MQIVKNITDLGKNISGIAKNIRLRFLGRKDSKRQRQPGILCWVVTGLTPQLYTRKQLEYRQINDLVTGVLGFSEKNCVYIGCELFVDICGIDTVSRFIKPSGDVAQSI